MAVIESMIRGMLRVLVVDITNNSRGWEYQMSADLAEALRSAGIDLSTEILQPRTDDEYGAIFCRADLDFNAVLLIAHGGRDTNEIEASPVVIPGGRSNWYQLSALTSAIRGKMMCLAVCHGFCQDAIEAFAKSDHFAMAVVAPSTKLSREEVIAFFPAFLSHVKAFSTQNIDPNDVARALSKTNQLAAGKMRLFSEGLSQ